jgi:hypothetical protein
MLLDDGRFDSVPDHECSKTPVHRAQHHLSLASRSTNAVTKEVPSMQCRRRQSFPGPLPSAVDPKTVGAYQLLWAQACERKKPRIRLLMQSGGSLAF